MTEDQKKDIMKSIAPYLGVGWYFDNKSYRYVNHLISGRFSLSFRHEKNRFSISAYVNPLKALESKYRIHGTSAGFITVTDKKTPAQIAKDIKKRIFPNFEESLKKVIKNENFYSERDAALSLYSNALNYILKDRLRDGVKKYERNYLRFGENISIDFQLYYSHSENALDINISDMHLDFDTFYEVVSLIKRKADERKNKSSYKN